MTTTDTPTEAQQEPALVELFDHADKPHPLTGGQYTIVLPPAGKRSAPITFTVTREEFVALRSTMAAHDDLVHVDVEALGELNDRARWADALDGAGVDNWEGCDYARDLLRDDEAAE